MGKKRYGVFPALQQLCWRSCSRFRVWSALAFITMFLFGYGRNPLWIPVCHVTEPFLHMLRLTEWHFIIAAFTVMIVADAPFFGSTDVFTVNRIGRVQWTAARLLYIALVTAAVTLYTCLVPTLLNLGRIDLSVRQYTADIHSRQAVLEAGTRWFNAIRPWHALAWQLLLLWLFLQCCCLTVYFLNLSAGRGAGVPAILSLIFAEYIAEGNFNGVLMHRLPMSHVYYFDHDFAPLMNSYLPGLGASAVYYGVWIAVCIIGIAYFTRRYEFPFRKTKSGQEDE